MGFLAIAPHRTVLADFPHTALQTDLQISRVNPSLAISDNRFSFVENLFSDSILGNCFSSTIHLCLSTPSLLRNYLTSTVRSSGHRISLKN